MELQVHGHGGRCMVVFPERGQRFFDFEHNGLVHAAEHFLAEGRVRFVCVDSVDHESWLNERIALYERGARHEAYDAYIVSEVVPYLRHRGWSGGLGACGCGVGAYHAANFLFRHPDVFDALVGLSGWYSLEFALGTAMDERAYFNSPIHYLPNLNDPWFLERIRAAQLVFAVGRHPSCAAQAEDARRLEWILRVKGIPAWVDLWGEDVTHDPAWWQRMLPYFVGQMV
jgi:esterase/lipase superfamily enzyme